MQVDLVYQTQQSLTELLKKKRMAAPVALNAMFVHIGFSAAAATILAEADQET
jgi:hypothetical protein